MRIKIDPANGHVTLGTCVLSPETTPDSLPDYFQLGPEHDGRVAHESVPCRFAKARIAERGVPVEIGLRFEYGLLTSCWFSLDPPVFTTWEEFTRDLDARFEKLVRWLTRRLGPLGKNHRADFSWGWAGVGKNKSEDVFACVAHHQGAAYRQQIRKNYVALARRLHSSVAAHERHDILIELAELFFRLMETRLDKDVTDGIELCIVNEGTKKMIPYLKKKAREFAGKDDWCVEAIASWIETIKQSGR